MYIYIMCGITGILCTTIRIIIVYLYNMTATAAMGDFLQIIYIYIYYPCELANRYSIYNAHLPKSFFPGPINFHRLSFSVSLYTRDCHFSAAMAPPEWITSYLALYTQNLHRPHSAASAKTSSNNIPCNI